MLAPRLRHRVSVQELVIEQDTETGAQIEVWTDLLTDEPCEIVPLSGREFVSAQAVQAGVSSRVTIRYYQGIKPSMRVVHDGVYYNIRAVLPDPTLRRWLSLMVEDGYNDG